MSVGVFRHIDAGIILIGETSVCLVLAGIKVCQVKDWIVGT